MARKRLDDNNTMPPLSDVQERASDVVFAEREQVSSPRVATVEPDAPGPFAFTETDTREALDRLLTLSWELPVAQGDEAVVRALIDGLAAILPGCSVGACLVHRADDPRGRFVARRALNDEPTPAHGDPTRLFPWQGAEAVIELPGELYVGTTLHAASDDTAIVAEGGAGTFVLHRAARLLARALEHVTAENSAYRARDSIDSLNAQMVQAEKLASLGQIAAGMVHELNNPLTSIVAYSDYLTKRWLAKGAEADSDELERLRRIGESAHRLLRFTRDLVSYARPSSEVPMPIVVHSVIDQAIVFCEHVLAETGARVERQFGDGILPVRGLPEQLTQVFVNLITNACHAMAEGGTLTLATELVDADASVRIVVADTGHGIPPQQQSKIFAPFFTTKSEGRGTGLGLAIVKSIVEGHQGQIVVESEPGRGTSFILLLPVAER